MGDFYIVDLRPQFRGNPYITLWRPDNAGYAYPIPWAGRYSKDTVDAAPSYYAHKDGSKRYVRFPVPCDVVEALAIPKPKPGVIDGDTGPVLINNKATRDALRAAKYLPIPQAEEVRHVG